MVKKLVSGPGLVRSVHGYKGYSFVTDWIHQITNSVTLLSLFLSSMPWRSGPLEVTKSFFLKNILSQSIKNPNKVMNYEV